MLNFPPNQGRSPAAKDGGSFSRRSRKLSLFIALVLWSGSALALDLRIPLPWEDEPPKDEPRQQRIEQPPPVREKAPNPPDIDPYVIPRFNGKPPSNFEGGSNKNYHYVPPIKLSKRIDADAVFHMVVNCFPYQPQWHIDVKAVAGARYTENNNISTFDTSGLARYYAGIVAEMPLYSTDEIYRLEEQERRRRGEVAKQVSDLLKALADRDRALRTLGIGESVEAREQYRNSIGVGSAEKQIGYLKEVAGSVAEYDAASAAITASRLSLVGQCRTDAADSVNNYLTEITQ